MLDASDLLFVGLLAFSFYRAVRMDYDITGVVLLSGSLSLILKLVFRVYRYSGLDLFSFPSFHAAVSFSVFFGYPNLLTFLTALLVGIFRIVEGYHSSIDVLAGALVALVSTVLYRKIKDRLGSELDRKVLHMGISITAGYFGLFYDQIVIGTLLMVSSLLLYGLRLLEPLGELYRYYGRTESDKGPITLSFSLFFSSTFGFLPLTAFVLGMVDVLSTIVGKIVKRHLAVLYNGKSVEGFLGALVGSFFVMFLLRGFYPPCTLGIVAALSPVVELLSPIDDNILLGFFSTVVGVICGARPS